MTNTGLRQLRQRASDLVRRAEAGETITVSVSGRPVAELGPVQRDQWRRWDDVADIFDGSADPAWYGDRERIDQAPVDPFSR